MKALGNMKVEVILLLLFCGCLAPFGVKAEEVQVPFDEGGRLTVIDKSLEAKLGLFPEYEGFQEARLFQSSDTTFTLEVLYQVGDKVQKSSQLLSRDQVAALRARVSSRIKAQAPETGLDQSGRSAFLIGTALLSLDYYGWAVPYVLHVDNASAYGGIYMLTSGLGFFGPFLITRHRSVTDGEATLSLYGATRGVLHGWCVSALLFGEDRKTRDTITSSMLTSLAEYGAGFFFADKTGIGGGTAEATATVGDFGTGLGWGASYLVDRGKDKLEAGSMLAGSALGLGSGRLLAGTQHYTRGDAYVLRAAGALGTYIAVAASASITDDGKAAVASSMAGAVGGLAMGHYLLRERDFTTGQGVVVNLSEVAGGLFAVGLLFITHTDTDPVWPYMAASSVGATAGFWLTYHSLSDKARTHAGDSSIDRDPSSVEGPSLRLNVYPQGVLASAARGKSRSISAQPAPILELQCRF